MSGLPRIEPARDVIDTASGSVPLTEIVLGPSPRGAVVVVCDDDHADHTGDILNGLALHGYESVAVRLPAEEILATDSPGGERLLRDIVGRLTSRLVGRGWSASQTGLIGCGVGGWAVCLGAGRDPFGAAVVVAPRGRADSVAPPRTPTLALVAASDRPAGAWSAATMARVQEPSPVYTEVVQYDGVIELSPASRDVGAYAVSFDAWQRTVEWLNLRVAPRLTELSAHWMKRDLDNVHNDERSRSD